VLKRTWRSCFSALIVLCSKLSRVQAIGIGSFAIQS
jgi:hypothetical protein